MPLKIERTGTFFCAWYASQKHWLANNILGLAFCIQGIEMLSLGSFKTGAILLAGLFVYDIFCVFFTPVMVSVAKSFDAPIKLLFPTSYPLNMLKNWHSSSPTSGMDVNSTLSACLICRKVMEHRLGHCLLLRSKYFRSRSLLLVDFMLVKNATNFCFCTTENAEENF
ncbi:hypothetical protein ACSBR2_020621 [Camellia fascicularis]